MGCRRDGAVGEVWHREEGVNGGACLLRLTHGFGHDGGWVGIVWREEKKVYKVMCSK